MNISEKKIVLSNKIADLEAQLAAANKELYELSCSLENNIYANLDTALSTIEKLLQTEAREDCEGSYNFGLEEYIRDFKVGDIIYTATLKVQYNRHDKTYYYVDETEFSYEEKTI